MVASAAEPSNGMQSDMFLSAGSARADDDGRFASAPQGQLLDHNALKPLKTRSSKLFDCTRNGTELAFWLEHVDKAAPVGACLYWRALGQLKYFSALSCVMLQSAFLLGAYVQLL